MSGVRSMKGKYGSIRDRKKSSRSSVWSGFGDDVAIESIANVGSPVIPSPELVFTRVPLE